MKKFLKFEKQYIDDAKYYQGLKSKKDPGDDYIMDWISTSGQEFRDKWNNSSCKNCVKIDECGHNLKQKCDNCITINKCESLDENLKSIVKTEYIDCITKEFENVLRIQSIDYEDTVNFKMQYKVNKFPIPQHKLNKKTKICKALYKFKYYIINIWNAIIGVPNWYNVNINMDVEEASKLYRFIKLNVIKYYE